jgi:hypothetical protein
MPVVKVLKNHVFNGSLRRVGTTYDVPDSQATERIRLGLVAMADLLDFVPPGLVNKVEYAMYSPRQFRFPEVESEQDLEDVDSVPLLNVIGKSGSWWIFTDDTKVLGKAAAAEKLGISLSEFEEKHANRFS